MVSVFLRTGLLRKTRTANDQLTLDRSSHFVLVAALGPRIDEPCVTAIAMGPISPLTLFFSAISNTIS